METREVGIFKQIKRRGGILSVKVQSRIAFMVMTLSIYLKLLEAKCESFLLSTATASGEANNHAHTD